MSQKTTMPTPEDRAICETIAPQLSAYVLGERDGATLQVIEEHVRGCTTCRQALAADRAVAALLPLSVPDAQPLPDLRARVIDAVDAAAQGRERPRRSSGWRGWMQPRLLWRGLALALLVALLGWNAVLQRDLNRLQSTHEQQQAALVALLRDPDLERRVLPAGDVAPGASGTLVMARDQQTAALTVEGMPALPADRVYQLWLVENDRRISGGTFTVDADGRAVLLLDPPLPISAYERAGVTVEPRGGSPGPTSPRVIGGPLG